MLFYLEFDDINMKEIYTQIAENVKKARKEKNITQEELALGIGHSTASMISKIEAGLENKHYSIKQLYLISKILNMPVSSFFENID